MHEVEVVPGVRIVTASGCRRSRISSGSSAATVSGRVVRTRSPDAQHRRAAGDSSHAQDDTDAPRPTVARWNRCRPTRPWCSPVAGRRAWAGRPSRSSEVGGRSILAAVLEAVADAGARVVVGPPQPVPSDVLLVREHPPGAARSPRSGRGWRRSTADVVAVLAGDLPFVAAALIGGAAAASHRRRDLVVDDAGRDQYLLGICRTAALRRRWPTSPGRPARRARPPDRPPAAPESRPAEPPPWTDCATPADLARARLLAGPGPVVSEHARGDRRGPWPRGRRLGRLLSRPRRLRRRHRADAGARGGALPRTRPTSSSSTSSTSASTTWPASSSMPTPWSSPRAPNRRGGTPRRTRPGSPRRPPARRRRRAGRRAADPC